MTAADLLPAGLDLWQFAILCAVSFLASLITATLSLGGGMLMLAVLALFIPPAALIPLHGAVQLGSNAGRAVLMRRDVLRPVLPAFIFGSIIGALIGGRLGSGPINSFIPRERICSLNRRKAAGNVGHFQSLSTPSEGRSAPPFGFDGWGSPAAQKPLEQGKACPAGLLLAFNPHPSNGIV